MLVLGIIIEGKANYYKWTMQESGARKNVDHIALLYLMSKHIEKGLFFNLDSQKESV